MWMLTFGIVIAGIAAVLLAAVFARVNGYASPQGKLLSKGLASAAFVVLGLLCAAKAGGSAYAVLAVLALAAGAVGDTLLQLSECRQDWREGMFMAGLIAFLLGHVLYVAAFMTAVQTTFWQFGVAAVMFAVLYALQFPAKIRLGSMKGPIYAYAAVITLMAAYAFSCARYGLAAMAALVVPAGAMFIASDAVLAAMLYGPKRTRRIEILNLVTYYGAQILLAFSVLTA
ncbi:MAG: lysoplasmalogenase [Candidatus Spyradocola sp.]